jgi:peptide/nickel transport system ATP-binding protein
MTAMALCPEPDLVVFDEPTTALDVTTQIDVLAAIKEAIRDTGVAALYITHDLAVVAQVSDHIMVLRHGEMVEYGTTDQIINSPQEEYTQALVSVRSIDHEEKVPTREPVLSVEQASPPAMAARNSTCCKNVNVEVHPGQTLAVVGESGSGKSTLARVITGLLPPREGKIGFADRELSGSACRALARGSARVADDLPDGRCGDEPAPDRGHDRRPAAGVLFRPEGRRKAKARAGTAGRDRDGQRLHRPLSGGACRAGRNSASASPARWRPKPKLIICDEVTSALDPLVADGILKLLLNLQAREDVAYLFITHDLATVRAIADSIAVMYQGEVVRYGPKSKCSAPPFDDYTDLLLSSVPEMKLGWLEEVIANRKMESAGN